MAADPTRPQAWSTVAKLLAVLLAAGVLAAGLVLPYVGGVGIVAGKAASKFLDTTCKLQESAPPQKTTVYARDGRTTIATLFSQDRVPIPLAEVPKYLQDALIATEDRRFYQHHGVDLRGLIRSAVSTSSGSTQGGSTLTMQYVKQLRYYQAGDDAAKQQAAVAVNLQRKMEDAKCALYIEGTLHKSKDQILDDYLNIAFFGEHSYGIQTAAETYFNKPASKLTLAESAVLVGLLRAPSAYDPFLNPAAAKERRNEVLQNLVSVGKLSQAAADKVEATPVALATQSPPQVRQGCANANSTVPNAAFFCEYVVNWLESHQGMAPSELQTGGLKIVTTLNPQLQERAQRNINQSVPAKSPMTAVLPVLDPHTGDILAMATSKTYGTGAGQTEQPVFTKYTAPGASTYKLFPLLVALSTGVPSTWQLTTAGSSGDYQTKNCMTTSKSSNGDANVFYNQTESMATATAKSSNTFFVGLADQLLNCNLQPIVNMMSALGMHGMDQHSPSDNPKLSYAQNLVAYQRAQQLVLGFVPTSPLELAGAYAAVANGGKFNAPAPVLAISDSKGHPIPVKRDPATQVVAPQVAAQAVHILSGDTHYPGTSAGPFQSWYSVNSSVVAGKTGTNESNKANQNSSVWFAGLTPDLVAVSAVINFDNTSIPSRGLNGEAPGAAYGDFAAKVWLESLRPTLANRTWAWPDPAQIGSQQVPDVLGMTLADARATLAENHFKLAQLGAADGLICSSPQPLNTVGYYGPQRADPGATITVCLSSGTPQTVIIPRPVYTPPPRHTGGGGGGTGGGTGGGGGGTTGGGGHGHGHGGGGGGGGGGHQSPGPGGGTASSTSGSSGG
ncbi:MAG TPA: transglycosylase domain-containing protein [Jatrophihabitans sp.]|nr:transglycosylase domain-containing protein [Jatrophihabitans sp.]